MGMKKRLVAAAAPIMLLYGAVLIKIFSIMTDEQIIAASYGRGTYTLTINKGRKTVYDRNMIPLVNTSKKYYAVIDPRNFNTEKMLRYITDHEKFREGMQGNTPFLCETNCSPEYAEAAGTTLVWRWERYPSPCPAQHIIGYTSSGKGVCGAEAVFDDFLSDVSQEKITYRVDALGQILHGEEEQISDPQGSSGGIVTTLDVRIQNICENAMRNIEKGAAVVMDIRNGQILASVSRPVYDIENISDHLNDSSSPFINRAFCAYSVGSVFKTVTAAAALEAGISEEYTHRCSGSIMIGSQRFGCHLWGGHGDLDMRSAMIESCNPYFISLGRNIPDRSFHSLILSAGFGSSDDLGGIISAAGYVPDLSEMAVPAEKANLCFGQGKLTATPIQVCRFICAAANKGVLPKPVLFLGTVDDISEYPDFSASYDRIISPATADKLKSFMHDTLMKPGSLGIPSNTDGGGKTSTAQTGRFDSSGNEYMNCWFAGFFPYDEPRYAVVVLAEEGKSGNTACAPVFKEIAENVTLLED